MDWDLFIAVVAGITVILCLLALSVIHLFWIPKDVLDRDTKPRKPQTAGDTPSGGTTTPSSAPPATPEVRLEP